MVVELKKKNLSYARIRVCGRKGLRPWETSELGAGQEGWLGSRSVVEFLPSTLKALYSVVSPPPKKRIRSWSDNMGQKLGKKLFEKNKNGAGVVSQW